jgi:hypothetical protein
VFRVTISAAPWARQHRLKFLQPLSKLVVAMVVPRCSPGRLLRKHAVEGH